MRLFFIGALALSLTGSLFAQNSTGYWQQQADYQMEIDVDAEAGQYKGKQVITYTNNSPDELGRVFYHLFFNAFQPGSEMDVRSRTISDPDPRVGSRISKLTPSEIGYIKPLSLTQDGSKLDYEVSGTILEVTLAKPLAPGASTVLSMEWDAQVPVQIRRSGRNNREGVAYSMTQWFPKLAEYDFEGWHANPYIGREFHGVWGNFDVKIAIDEDYTVGGTGYLQGTPTTKRGKKTWHFVAPDVHDFTWAADKDYIHDTYAGPNGVTLNFYYKNDPDIIDNWKALQPVTAQLMEYFNTHIGTYPYKQYSVIQGGDGGMEYAMCTLITGQRKFNSLVGVTAHELAHTWFQFLLATNESKHEWMDEGFTTYVSSNAMNEVMKQNESNPNAGSYRGYIRLANSGRMVPATTHADRYESNRVYGTTAYSKGCVFMAQLGYVIGEEPLSTTIKRFFKEWAYKHPTPNDFIRVAEKVSGMELDWYLMDFMQTTNTIDYGVSASISENGATKVTLERVGLMPMPIDLKVTLEDGTESWYYIPLAMMRGEKSATAGKQRKVLDDWAWAYPTYEFEIAGNSKVKRIEIDPSKLMADVNDKNNSVKLD
ncbi:MAG: M1 family metallopeptidase [Bacteroidota bacterium]